MRERPSTIMLIGNDAETRQRLQRLFVDHLSACALEVHAETKDALEYATHHPVQGIVVDGTEDALGCCRQLKSSDVTKPIPLMLLIPDAETMNDEASVIGVEDSASRAVPDTELVSRLRWMLLLHRSRMAERRANARIREMETANREAIRTIERRYRRLVDAWPDTMIICTDGVVTYINEAGKQLFSPKLAEEMIGRSAEAMVHASSRDVLQRLVHSCEETDETAPYVLMKLEGRDGQSIHVEAAALCFERSDGKHVLLVLRDVGERENLSVKFQKAQRLEAVGQLAGGVAHDFNNILTTIRGYSDLVLQNLTESDPLTKDMQEIKNATERAASLTRQLLAFSRRQVLEPSSLDLNRVVLEIKRMLMRIIGEHIELTTDLEPELGVIRADRSQIEQVIMNLAINARDAIPDRGSVILTTRNVEFKDERQTVGLELTPGPYVLLQMTDTGVGMSDETALRIFEPFFTTKGADKGTGLGLSTVYGIIKQSGGDITVTTQLGKGTIFRIYLPMRPELALAMAPVRTEQGPARGWETILLVEDESTVRFLAKRLLERAGYTVITAQHGQEALDLCDSHEGPIHLIVTDVVMPRMGGLELVKQLLSRFPDLKVILMSGYSESDAFNLDETPVAFLQKPFSYEELTREVRKMLDGDTK